MNKKIKRISIEILPEKYSDVPEYNLMKVIETNMEEETEYRIATISKKTDAITIILPENVKNINVEAIDTNRFNIWYRVK